MPKALIIDDESDLRELLQITLSRMDIDTDCAESVHAAKQYLNSNKYDLCLSDMRLPDGNGLDLLDYMQGLYPEMPVAIITAYGTVETAIKALKNGAFDFILKPIDLTTFRNIITSALELSRVKSVSASLQFIGSSKLVQDIKVKIGKLARSQAPVHIYGPSGSGKELIARLIHAHSPREDKPFIPVNCGAIPKDLIESELFGHVKGSFTGATKDNLGLIMAANGGTLFLDEIGELPLDMQVKFLRFIQERTVRQVGSHKEQTVNIRLLSATNKNLHAMVANGEFREDLYYRINVIELQVPPLQHRIEDLDELVQYILANLATKNNLQKLQISATAMQSLREYSFPGNVRELENILERSIALSDTGIIEAEDLNLHCETSYGKLNDIDLKNDDLESYMDNVEKQAILEALNKCQGNKKHTAELLGVSLRALRYKLKKLDLE